MVWPPLACVEEPIYTTTAHSSFKQPARRRHAALSSYPSDVTSLRRIFPLPHSREDRQRLGLGAIAARRRAHVRGDQAEPGREKTRLHRIGPYRLTRKRRDRLV